MASKNSLQTIKNKGRKIMYLIKNSPWYSSNQVKFTTLEHLILSITISHEHILQSQAELPSHSLLPAFCLALCVLKLRLKYLENTNNKLVMKGCTGVWRESIDTLGILFYFIFCLCSLPGLW